MLGQAEHGFGLHSFPTPASDTAMSTGYGKMGYYLRSQGCVVGRCCSIGSGKMGWWRKTTSYNREIHDISLRDQFHDHITNFYPLQCHYAHRRTALMVLPLCISASACSKSKTS